MRLIRLFRHNCNDDDHNYSFLFVCFSENSAPKQASHEQVGVMVLNEHDNGDIVNMEILKTLTL